MAIVFIGVGCRHLRALGTLMTTDTELVQKYLSLQERYLEEAKERLAGGDISQASEKFWGAAAEIVKAAAQSRGVRIKTHADLWNFVYQLDEEYPKIGLPQKFRDAHFLHSNFYEDDLLKRVVEDASKSVIQLVHDVRKLVT